MHQLAQIMHISILPGGYNPFQILIKCLKQINNLIWNFLQLNKDKAEVLLWSTDSDLNFNSHMKSVIQSAELHLENISRREGRMCRSDLEKLLHAFIFRRLDDCNRVFPGLPKRWSVSWIRRCCSLRPEKWIISLSSWGLYTGFLSIKD